MEFWDIFIDLCYKSNSKPNNVAKELEISSGILTKWKHGSLPSTAALLKISQYFDVSIDYLLGRELIGKDVISKMQDKCKNSEIMQAYEKLPIKDQLEVQLLILNKAEKSDSNAK